jgi:dihydroneopterin aldolase
MADFDAEALGPLIALLARDGETRRIFLRDFRVQASIGIHDFEKTARQTIAINIDLFVQPSPPADDSIENVLDYDFLRRRIGEIVAARHFNLQETLCEEIVALCLSQPQVLAVRVSTAKPDVYPDCEAVGCEVFRLRR